MTSPLWPAPEAWQSIFGGLEFIIKGKLIDYLASWASFSLSTAWWTLQSTVPQIGCLVSKSDRRFDCEKSGIMRLAELMEIWLQHWAERVISSFAVFLAVIQGLCQHKLGVSLPVLAFEIHLYFLPERCTHVYLTEMEKKHVTKQSKL